jgi:hypothetical protein
VTALAACFLALRSFFCALESGALRGFSVPDGILVPVGMAIAASLRDRAMLKR